MTKYFVTLTAGGLFKIFTSPKTELGFQRKYRYCAGNGINKYGMGYDPVILTEKNIPENDLDLTIRSMKDKAINMAEFKPYTKSNGSNFYVRPIEVGMCDHHYDSGHWK